MTAPPDEGRERHELRARLIALEPALARPLIARLPSDERVGWTAWADALEGHLDLDLTELRARARAAGRSATIVELTALEALTHAETSPKEAEALARRGARMAATEELPDPAFLANVTLARIRRLLGRPHLATHILATLARYAPPAWHLWIGWELALSFGHAGAGLLPSSAPIVAAIRSACAGTEPPCPALFERDLATLRALSVPDTETTDAEILAFRHGRSQSVPRGLHGLAAIEDTGALAWVAVEGGQARRLLALGLEPFERRGFLPLEQSQRVKGRADMLIAACAMAGEEGIDEEALFLASYGFPFVPELHGGTFGLAIHRARNRLGDVATIERARGRLRLVASRPLLIPDPRCAVGTEDRALQHIALGGAATARAIADALGVSLRSAQLALEALIREGLCDRARVGNAVVYRVEDTTFHEPTQRDGAPPSMA